MVGKANAQRSMQQQQVEAEQDERISQLEQQQQYQQQPYQQPYQQPPAPPEAPAAAPAASSPMIDQLNQLASLHQQGVLSDDEFAAAKAKLIGT
jgi:Tfp pilus assembly protein PilP